MKPAPVTRRSFLTSTVAAAAGTAGVAGAVGCMPASKKSRPRFGDLYEVIDAHVHLPSAAGRVGGWHPVITDVETYVRYLRECGVEFIIGTGGVDKRTRTEADVVESNDAALHWQAQYPDFIRANCQANPNFLETSLAEMERMRVDGCAWLGELVAYSHGYTYDTPQFSTIVEKAVELNMVIQIHCGPEELNRLAKQFPKATFVLCHFADIGHGRAEQVDRIDAVAANPNCYLDTSGAGIERIGMLELACEKAGADRLIYGSDMPINDPSQALTRVAHAFLSEPDKELIFAGNVRRLLRERGVAV